MSDDTKTILYWLALIIIGTGIACMVMTTINRKIIINELKQPCTEQTK